METAVQALDVAATSLETSISSVTSVGHTQHDRNDDRDQRADDDDAGGPDEERPAHDQLDKHPDLGSGERQDHHRTARALTRIPFVQRPATRPYRCISPWGGLRWPGWAAGSFITMGDSLTEASENMQTMQTDVTLIATNIDTIQASLAQTVVSQYRTVVADLQEKLEGTAEQVPGTINRAA